MITNTLIVYFSRADENYFSGTLKYVKEGNTEVAAHMLKEMTGADILPIWMENPYSADYHACVEEARKDLAENARPKLVGLPKNLDGYDTILLGYPNYCGTIPMAVATFLESYDMTGKTIHPFCTNEGSGMGSSVSDIKKSAPGAKVSKGLPINGSRVKSSEKQLKAWVEGL